MLTHDTHTHKNNYFACFRKCILTPRIILYRITIGDCHLQWHHLLSAMLFTVASASTQVMTTVCFCLVSHESCLSVTNVLRFLWATVPDQQIGWPPNNLRHSTFGGARPWNSSIGPQYSQMFCQINDSSNLGQAASQRRPKDFNCILKRFSALMGSFF